MEIGGYDIIIKTKNPNKLAKEIINLLNWNESVIEHDEGEDFFYYKDKSAKEEWDNFNGKEDTMIHLLFDKEQLTVVANEKTAQQIKEYTRNEN